MAQAAGCCCARSSPDAWMRGCESKILWPSSLLFLGSTVGEGDKRADSGGFAVWEWPALGLPLPITCTRGETRGGGTAPISSHSLAGPDGTRAIGEEEGSLLLLWTAPDFFFWGAITMTRKVYAVCEQAEESSLSLSHAQAGLLAVSDEIDGPPTARLPVPVPAREPVRDGQQRRAGCGTAAAVSSARG